MLQFANLSFANLKKNIIQDLINNKSESILYHRYSKEQVVRMMSDPQKNEKEIRELSGFIYLVSSHYRRLVDYYSTILLYNYIVVPTKIPTKKPNKTTYKNNYYHVVNECEKYNLRHECTKAIKIAVRDGVYYGLTYETDDSFYIKPFDNRHARISSIEDGAFKFSIDLNYFNGKQYLLDMYGPEMTVAYEAYKGNKEKGIEGDKNKRWYEAPNGVCIKVDESDPVYSLPLFCGLLLDILSIDDYKMLQKSKAENDNYKVLSAKIPTDDDGVPKMDFGVAQKYYGQMSQNLPEGIGLLLSPFDVQDFSFQTSTASDKNNVTDAINTFWQGAGTSSALFGGGNISSSSAMLLSVKPDEAISFSILQQLERFFNKKIKLMNLTYSFKISFLNQSIFNSDEVTNRLSKGATYAMPLKMKYCAALGLSPSDVLGLTYLEETALGLGDQVWKTPLLSTNTTSTNTSSSDDTGGRPTNESKGVGLDDAGQQTKDTDANDNR